MARYVSGLLSDVQRKHVEAIGSTDETGTSKSGQHTCGVKRQYNCNRGKIENCVNHVALTYTTPTLSRLIDVQLYLPQEWADVLARGKNECSG